MRKANFLLSAAILFAATPMAQAAAAPASLRLPPPKAPKDQILSPGAIDQGLKKLGYRIERMKRKGTTYAVTAIGRSGNRVQLTVDGRSGAIIGLAVLKAAPGQAAKVAAAVKSRKGTRYVDDSSPFGIIIPDIFTTRWTVVPSTQWIYSVEYIPESWAYAGWGYRFAVPYYSIRPGHDGYSVTTFDVTDLNDPIYEVYDYEGTEIVTEYSEESFELTAAEEWDETWAEQEEQLEESYLDGSIDEMDVEITETADFDSEDGDFDVGDDPSDDYDDEDYGGSDDGSGDNDESDDADDAEDFGDEGEGEDDDGSGEDDDGGDEGDYDDGGDEGGDEDYEDGGDEPEAARG